LQEVDTRKGEKDQRGERPKWIVQSGQQTKSGGRREKEEGTKTACQREGVRVNAEKTFSHRPFLAWRSPNRKEEGPDRGEECPRTAALLEPAAPRRSGNPRGVKGREKKRRERAYFDPTEGGGNPRARSWEREDTRFGRLCILTEVYGLGDREENGIDNTRPGTVASIVPGKSAKNVAACLKQRGV